MKTTTRTIAIRVIGAVLAGFFAVSLSAGPADARSVNNGGASTVSLRDTGW